MARAATPRSAAPVNAPSRSGTVCLIIDADTDWIELTELRIDSYRVCAQ